MKIAVLAGGISPERDVSLCSGAKISNALRNNGHEVVLIDLFLGIEGNIKIPSLFKGKDSGVTDIYNIPENPPSLEEVKNKRKDKSESLFGSNVIEICRFADKVFIALHGATGEDGRVQAVFDMYGIKYTGSSYIACGIAMNKELTKKILNQSKIPMAEGIYGEETADTKVIMEKIGLPCVIKPCNGGSSIGVTIVRDEEHLKSAIKYAKEYGDRIIIEKYVPGREFSVGVLVGEALPPIEIIPKQGFYDYKNKYQSNSTDEICPADLDKKETEILKSLALKVHNAIGMGSYSRSDFIRRGYGDFIFLEINTLPGMTPTSLLPQEAKAVGVGYEELCETIVQRLICKGRSSMKLSEIIEFTDGILMGDANLNQEITGFTTDTRNMILNAMYVPLVGENRDGHMFIEDALKAGAIGTFTHKDISPKKGKIIIKVEDTQKAFQDLARGYRRTISVPLIAVTGSVGKTTTKDMVAGVMEEKFSVLKSEGNFNNAIGLPTTLLRYKDEQIITLEMGMNHFGEISLLTNIAHPDVAIFTNIGHAHIGILGSRENILKAKMEIVEGMNERGTIILNNDDDLLQTIKEKVNQRVITYGIKNKADHMAYDIKVANEFTTFKIKHDGDEYEVKISLPGEHFVYDALAAWSAGILQGVEPEKIIKGIEHFEPSKMRMDIIERNDIKIINDTYNAGPESMKASLKTLKNLIGGRKIAILGDMLELGDFSNNIHFDLGTFVGNLELDFLLTVGDGAKEIAKGAIEEGMNHNKVLIFNNRNEAIEKIKSLMRQGDVILVKGSHAMKMYEIVESIL